MSALATLETGLLLGLYALLAGIWGVLWALAQLRLMPIVAGSAVAAYALHVLAVLRWVIGVAPLVSFWIILLAGIAVGIASMWSMLYRPAMARSAAPS